MGHQRLNVEEDCEEGIGDFRMDAQSALTRLGVDKGKHAKWKLGYSRL